MAKATEAEVANAKQHIKPVDYESFADFLDAHYEAGLGTIPTVLVGHMSGENWDPPWRGGRDLYRDVWLVGQQAWLAQELAAAVDSLRAGKDATTPLARARRAAAGAPVVRAHGSEWGGAW